MGDTVWKRSEILAAAGYVQKFSPLISDLAGWFSE